MTIIDRFHCCTTSTTLTQHPTTDEEGENCDSDEGCDSKDATTTYTQNSEPSSTDSETTATKSGLNAAIIGAVLGVAILVIVLVIIATLAVFVLRVRNAKYKVAKRRKESTFSTEQLVEG